MGLVSSPIIYDNKPVQRNAVITLRNEVSQRKIGRGKKQKRQKNQKNQKTKWSLEFVNRIYPCAGLRNVF